MATILSSVEREHETAAAAPEVVVLDRKQAIEQLLAETKNLFRAGARSVCMISVGMARGDDADDENRHRLDQLTDAQLTALTTRNSAPAHDVA